MEPTNIGIRIRQKENNPIGAFLQGHQTSDKQAKNK